MSFQFNFKGNESDSENDNDRDRGNAEELEGKRFGSETKGLRQETETNAVVEGSEIMPEKLQLQGKQVQFQQVDKEGCLTLVNTEVITLPILDLLPSTSIKSESAVDNQIGKTQNIIIPSPYKMYKRTLHDINHHIASTDDNTEVNHPPSPTLNGKEDGEDIIIRASIEDLKLNAPVGEAAPVENINKKKDLSLLPPNDKNSMTQSILEKSDIIRGVYEGGIKTWECSMDLAAFLLANPGLVQGKSILELGCGSALPSIVAYNLGAKQLTLQDYNENVLHYVSIPNLLLNTCYKPTNTVVDEEDIEQEKVLRSREAREGQEVEEEEEEFDVAFDSPLSAEAQLLLTTKVSLYSGAWANLKTMIPSKKHDLILTSETIYDSDNFIFLLELIRETLSPAEGAVCLVAAKHMYFGCSGSLTGFKDMALLVGFRVTTLWTNVSGIRRAILGLYLK